MLLSILDTFFSTCSWWLLPLLFIAWWLGWLFYKFLRGDGYKNRIKVLESEKSKLATDLGSAQQDLNAKVAAFANLESEHDALNNKFSGLQSNFYAEQKNREKLEGKLADWQGKHATLEGELGEWQGKYTTLEGNWNTEKDAKVKALAALATATAATKKWESDFGGLQTKFAALEGNYNGLNGRYTTLEGDLNNAREDAAKWKGEYETLKGNYDLLKGKLEEANEKADHLAGELNQSNEQYTTLENNHNSKMTQWETDMKNLTNLYATLETKYETADVSAQKWEKDYNGLQTRYTALEGDLRKANESAGKWETNYNGLQTKFATLEGDFNTTKADHDKNYSALNLLYTNLQNEHQSANANIANNEATLAKYKTRIAELEDELKTTKGAGADKLAALESDVANYKNRIAELEKDLKGAQKWEGNFNNLNGKFGDLETKHNGLNKDYQTLSSRFVALELKSANWCSEIAKEYYGKKIKRDDLTVVEGIGPKIQGLLHDANIKTWEQLWKTDVAVQKQILQDGGSRFQMHDPATWSDQAKLAHFCQWARLKEWQDELDGGRKNVTLTDEQKAERLSGAKAIFGKVKWDDLKVVEGIGPKIEQLCHVAGIKTWKALSEAKVETLQKMLDDAGPRYRLAVPGSWAKQAKMAYRGEWKKLKTWQDEHSHGRE